MNSAPKWWHYALGVCVVLVFSVFWWKQSVKPQDMPGDAPRGIYAAEAEKAAEHEAQMLSEALKKKAEGGQ